MLHEHKKVLWAQGRCFAKGFPCALGPRLGAPPRLEGKGTVPIFYSVDQGSQFPFFLCLFLFFVCFLLCCLCSTATFASKAASESLGLRLPFKRGKEAPVELVRGRAGLRGE